jgi:hypothetical protein
VLTLVCVPFNSVQLRLSKQEFAFSDMGAMVNSRCTNFDPVISHSGHWRRRQPRPPVPMLPQYLQKLTQIQRLGLGRFVPKAAVSNRSKVVFYSITSSARASTVGGTSRPSVLAVLRLMTSSYLVGVCTGSSAGFSPLRMRST